MYLRRTGIQTPGPGSPRPTMDGVSQRRHRGDAAARRGPEAVVVYTGPVEFATSRLSDVERPCTYDDDSQESRAARRWRSRSCCRPKARGS